MMIAFPFSVTPAKAGVQTEFASAAAFAAWIPAFAGMTIELE